MEDALWWLRLAALNETARRKRRLLEVFGHPEAIFSAGEARWIEAGLKPGHAERLREGAKLDVSRDLDRLEELGIDLVPLGDPRYPPLLAAIDDPPVVLFVRGRLPEANRPCVALVGTRRTSPYGELVAEELARELAAVGVGVISGLAAGIDTAAHRGALVADGYTAAVTACAVDVVYPRANASLHQQLTEQGGVISEVPLGTPPVDWMFPVRNRIISGLSRAVVVVQAPHGSGALITARLAAEQNREVMAVPGNVTDARQSGCHALIRDGAVLVRNADDVLAAIGLERQEASIAAAAPAPLPPLTIVEEKVAGALGLMPLSIDDLIEHTGLATPEVQSALVTLELKRVAQRLPGNRFVRAT